MSDVAVWPGARITFGRLGLTPGLWEPMPAPDGAEPSAALIQAQIREARARDMERCPVEKAVLAAQPGGRRIPPRYGPCASCGWSHALLPEGGAE